MTTSLRRRIAEHPTTCFFVLTYVISWTLMTPAMIWGLDSLAAIPFFVGVFGPAAAAAIVTRVTGDSIRAWLRTILRRPVALRWYAVAIAFPVALAGVASAEFALAGEELDLGLLGERAGAFVPLFVYCLLLNGGPEELGWRGFALPRLQERLTPLRATLVIGLLWGLWHLPLLLAEDNPDHGLGAVAFGAMTIWTLAGFTAYAVTYTYLVNRTGSALACMVLHAAYNTALGVVILRPEDELVGNSYVVLSLCLTGTLWLVALVLIGATRGRLGRPVSAFAASPSSAGTVEALRPRPSRRPPCLLGRER